MPRRKKPIYRPRNIILLLLALFAFAVGRQVYLSINATPGAAINFTNKVIALIESVQPEGTSSSDPDGYRLLNQGITRLNQIEAEFRTRYPNINGSYPIDYTVLRGEVGTRGYGKDALPQIQKASREAIEELKKSDLFSLMSQAAATKRAIRPTPPGKLIEILLPNLGKYRQFARLNGARMYLAHQAGDEAELVSAFEQTLAIGRIAAIGSLLIEQLVGIAIDSLALDEIRTELVERPPSEEAMLAMLAAIDRQPLPPMSFAIEGERLALLDTIQWTHTDDGRGSGRLITSTIPQLGMAPSSPGSWMSQVTSSRLMNLGGAAFPSKAASIRKANEFYDLAAAAASQPYFSRNPSAKDVEDIVEKLPSRYIVVKSMVPAAGHSLRSRDQYETFLGGTRIMLALEIFKKRNGRYPASLDELAPSILPTLPVDPFTGRNYCYRILESDPSNLPYLLYSTGADRADNGGATKLKDEYAAIKLPGGQGFDIILNKRRWKPGPEDMEPEPDPAPPPTEPVPDAPATPATPASP